MKSLIPSLLASLGCTAFAAEPPNVVFIRSDNQSYWEFGCHGNPVVKTP